jgi:hypothetical protein
MPQQTLSSSEGADCADLVCATIGAQLCECTARHVFGVYAQHMHQQAAPVGVGAACVAACGAMAHVFLFLATPQQVPVWGTAGACTYSKYFVSPEVASIPK